MKRIISKIILLTSLSLVGCSTNTQSENTVAGTLTGAVIGGLAGSGIKGSHGAGIGIGAAAGAIIGAMIGHYIDSVDNNKTYPFLSKDYPLTQPGHWENPQTHINYVMTPTSNLYSINGNPNCRNFHFSSTNYRKRDEFDGTACLVTGGRWERVFRT